MVKYFACGEYGGRSNRPHYHAIIYGVTDDDIMSAWQLDGKALGHIHIGTTSGASARYVANYLCKAMTKGLQLSQEKEFQVMSTGLGKAYLTPAMVKWHKENAANYVAAAGKAKQSLPRYYKDKIFTQEEKLQFAREHQERQVEKSNAVKKKHGIDMAYHKEFESKKQVEKSASYRESLRNKL